MSGHRVEASRHVHVDPIVAFERLLGAQLEEVFVGRYAAFPAIRSVTDAPETWGAVGQTRTIHLADGGRLRETLTELEGPRSYSYLLDDIHGMLRPYVRTIDGVWTVTPGDGGAIIGWAWTLHPERPPARLTLNVLGRMWKGYADRALGEIDKILTRE